MKGRKYCNEQCTIYEVPYKKDRLESNGCRMKSGELTVFLDGVLDWRVLATIRD